MSTETEHIKPMHILIRKGQDGRPEIADVFTSDWWDTVRPGQVVAVREKSRKRTLPLHNAVHAYLKLIFSNQERWQPWELFKYVFQLRHGLGDYHTIGAKTHFVPWKWSFEAMAQDVFLKVRDAAEAEGIERGFTPFSEWVERYTKERGDTTNRERKKCANPICGNIATDEHHIFGGTAFRKRSDELGYVVKICRPCHDASEDKGEINGITAIEWYRRLWCDVIGVDFDEAYAKVAGAEKIYRIKRGVGNGNGDCA